MTGPSPQAVAAARAALGIPDGRFLRHVAIIMDGNGRWARSRGLPRSAGHAEGAKRTRRIVTEAVRLGLEALTLYSFSIENWRRPPEEVDTLMHLYAEYLLHERPTVMANNVRMRHLGRRDRLPARAELTDAVRSIAARAAAGQIAPPGINEQTISDALDTAGICDPDLLIRTAGEMRISNFLLWQVSYTEFYVTDVLWPDFDEEEFRKAIQTFCRRRRRFGGVNETTA